MSLRIRQSEGKRPFDEEAKRLADAYKEEKATYDEAHPAVQADADSVTDDLAPASKKREKKRKVKRGDSDISSDDDDEENEPLQLRLATAKASRATGAKTTPKTDHALPKPAQKKPRKSPSKSSQPTKDQFVDLKDVHMEIGMSSKYDHVAIEYQVGCSD